MSPAKHLRQFSHDRRSHRRYPIGIGVNFRPASRGHVQVGRGTTINLSSGGVIFEAEVALPVEASIELLIPWPARNQHQIQLELQVTGKAVRVEGRRVAVEFARSVLATAKTPGERRSMGWALN
jgi:PilZ domain